MGAEKTARVQAMQTNLDFLVLQQYSIHTIDRALGKFLAAAVVEVPLCGENMPLPPASPKVFCPSCGHAAVILRGPFLECLVVNGGVLGSLLSV